ncbi:phosphate acetyltransferase [Eubacterium oxidoreducens]|uniref:Phosphate acetyltransferase n=1 Tax=Eubacterium oxidoreducens TaxID=1732 RepID=A0A1G6BHM2_EUBOX|nr:phosphate acetyltransferase [Eubacterium oxidoreducens]SDB20120.1 phosphate acetyltransferase [Eubacterium oxidoreducens]
MAFIDEVKAKAKAEKKLIILPESEDDRTYFAAEQTMKEGIADLVMIGAQDVIADRAKKLGVDLTGVKTVDPATSDKLDAYVAKLTELRAKKGMTEEKAREILLNDYPTFGILMLKMGDADGLVSGACHSTADILRPALQILKTAPGTKMVSSFFILDTPTKEYGADGVLMFADCALCQDPSSEELATIAGSCAESFKTFVGADPKIAFLSHSTMGSAKHDLVDKVHNAVDIAKEEYPSLDLDGELQLDAAIVPSVGELKAPNSKVAGHANVLVFPNIDAGNIGYKLVQRFAKAEAYGPVLQGIAAPVNDLSRGCFAEDIVGVVALTALQAQLSK